MAIDIKSYNQILGEMVRKIIANTSLNDVNTGSALLTLLEAAAQVDFENSASILSVLELLSIDAVRNNDLDSRAADLGLTRIPAKTASGFVTIKDSNITKRSTGLYQVKLPPISGATQIFVNDASLWAATGNLFLGRGTQNFEGPIPYTSIVNNGSFFTIMLGAALQKDHLISDTVIDSQGTADRLISAGTAVQIPANNQNPAIQFVTLRNAIIASGEDTIENVNIVANIAGSGSNAGINTITNFPSPPFSGATVFNTVAITNGSDVETDNALRERIKSYAGTLARGTSAAILSAIIGLSDPEDSKQVASAVITEPPSIGEPSIVYIDDGSGFQPSFAGQSVDKLIANATGNEEFLQLANFPLPRPQAINAADSPYQLADGMVFRVMVDGIEESVIFSKAQFVSITSATISEVIVAINSQSISFKATFTSDSSRILIFPTKFNAETIQVSELKISDDPTLFANNVLKFPTNEFSYIRLFQNNVLLNEEAKTAILFTLPFSSWNITAPGDLSISVDGTPAQDQGFNASDFAGASFATLNIDDWVTAFNAKFAGITAVATSSGSLQITSNKIGSKSALSIAGGTYLNNLFSGQPITSVGQNSDFELNRQTGNLRILTTILPGDSISAGTPDAKGAIFSTQTITGNFNLSTDSNGRPADMVVVTDSLKITPRVGAGLATGNTIVITDQGSSIMRLTSDSLSTFAAVQPEDFLYITSRGITATWFDPADTGLFKIITRGGHTVAGTDTYVEVQNANIVPGTHTVLASEDLQAFKAATYPQLWKGTFTPTPAAASLQDIVNSFTENIVNVDTSIFKTNSIKVTSSTEDNGSIAIPVSVGSAAQFIASFGHEELGNPSMIANRTSSKDLVSFFKRTEPTDTNADGVAGKVVWLNRYQYNDINGLLTSNAVPGVQGVDTYGEILQSTGVLTAANVSYDDTYNALSGANKGQYRSVRDKLSGDKIGTQFELPITLMDYIVNDEFDLMRPIALSPQDSIIFIMDEDPVNKTIDVPMWRTGCVNSNFPATNLSFSADDTDNEPGINFGNLQVWGKVANNTEFKNYAVWMRARNWYVSGGAGSGGGSFIIRSKEYGPDGENIRFNIIYPSIANQAASISNVNFPDYTQVTYTFGSGVVKPIGIVPGDQFTVTSLGNDQYRYTFTTGSINLATIAVNDILSILSGSGVSVSNSGQLSILAVNPVAKTIDVYNPGGSITGVGSKEISTVTTVADVIGTQTVSTISNITASAALDGKWFKLNDSAGSVAVYYNVGTPAPSPGTLGVNRIIQVGPLTGTESAATVTALTSGVISADPEFTASYLSTAVTVTNKQYGSLAIATDGTTPTGFTFAGSLGTASNSLDGEYFIIQDVNGSVAFWYDTSGITSEPLHGAHRAVRISTVLPGDSANTVATKTAVVIVGDGAWSSATVLSYTITVTDAVNGPRPAPSAGTSGFTVTETYHGVNTAFETVTITASFLLFSLTGTSVNSIVTTISTSPIVDAVALSSTNPIVKATQDEVYIPNSTTFSGSTVFCSPTITTLNTTGITVGETVTGIGIPANTTVLSIIMNTSVTLSANATATGASTYVASDYSLSLAYGHNPDPTTGLNGFVSFYDGISWVKDFNNTNPNFLLKTPMTLQGVAPSTYSIVSAPNPGTVVIGEFFKLVPITLNNVYHQFTQKAMSQLPIVAGIDISNDIRRIQVKSKLLGSVGAVEVVGGNANNIVFSISGEAQVVPGLSKNFLEAKTAAFPVTLTKGDMVLVKNTLQAKRLSRLQSGDTIDVATGVGNEVVYLYDQKNVNINQFVMFSVSDVSSTYARPSGTVWRWTHNDGGSVFQVTGLINGFVTPAVNNYIANGTASTTALQNILIAPGSGVAFAGTTSTGFSIITGVTNTTGIVVGQTVTGPGIPAGAVVLSFITNTSVTLNMNATASGSGTFVAGLSTPQQFQLTVSTLPTQADYFTFQSSSGVMFAVWFSVNGNLTAPTGATFLAVPSLNRLMVSILSTDTNNQIVSKLSTVLLTNTTFLSNFSAFQTSGTSMSSVNPGDLLNAYGTFGTGWSSGNKSYASGNGAIGGFPIIAVNAASSYIDVVNPDGVAMSNQAIGNLGHVEITPTPVIKWNLKHSAKTNVIQVLLSAPYGTATVTTSTEHRLREGDTFILDDNGISQTTTVVAVPSATTFTFTDTLGATAGIYILGDVIRSGKAVTRYKIESIGFNNLFRIKHTDGDSPGFVDCGVAVDDMLTISGNTFSSINSNIARILAVDNDSLIYQYAAAVEELNTIVPFNNLNTTVTWTANLNQVTGVVGAFKNVAVGNWVKQPEDDETLYVQVLSLLNSSNVPTTAALATKILLGNNYGGKSAVSLGVRYDQVNDVNKGVYLQNVNDIVIYEGDSVRLADSLFVDNIANPSWFSSLNSGTFTINEFGTDGITYRPYVGISNILGENQSGIQISVSPIGFFIIEGENAEYESVRKIEHTAINSFDNNFRDVYMTPPTKVDKLSQSNGTTIVPLGKLQYNTDVTTGVDGYTYYTGLLRAVQRTIDGFEPDPVSFPGLRAVGGFIETLPPLIRRIVVSVQVTTNIGVNLNDISNDVKSAIINYIDGLGVNQDVILSAIIVAIMNISGVAAVTFNVPVPETERISVAANEKAFIEVQDISVT